ncbi:MULTISPECIES: EAL domain-containing protein [unclassified Mesorhizobium]|uniref:putative bifunctional diguanylate cyclase/phosphodiesterase n=1 Tax=unclassified Mesorhizobium TaxID=325217 RepID=UPI00112622EF|nr:MULTISPECIES: EAL domain-containing protein [unclassified Mesorhizobium]TPN44841.1 EAL domain-containing protein [Mesorhizobium sp. B1-1-7]TPN46641.1 EAL domain-containing protein [Mesorhizobium sp. B1-1-9]
MTVAEKQPPLADILQAAPFGLTVLSQAGDIVYANRAGTIAAGNITPAKDLIVDGRVIRTLRFDVADQEAPLTVALSLDVTDQCELENDLFQQAFFDELTGLPNRALMERSFTDLIGADSAPFALAFIDLDGFKHINDYYGHTVGDLLLGKIATRLSGYLRPTDMLVRIGGDEFVLLISPVGTMEELASDIERVSQSLKEPFYADGFEIFSSASIGVSLYPKDGTTFDLLRTNADSAMYRSKGSAKGSVKFFDRSMEHAIAERTRLEQRLRFAIRDKRLCCAYQPKVDFRSGTTVGVEVLLRWRDEDGVIQAPGDFIELALELGLMNEVTHLILTETIDSVDRINEAFGHEASISINVAAKQAGDPRFMRSLIDSIDATGYPDRFMLELTEEAFLAKSNFQDCILPMIREIGARVSIDDFGVGYSSLSALADITADEIKVDRSFITDVHRRPRSQSILKAIESLGQLLGMSVIVEGVETFEELTYLLAATRISCAQGYYFGKPLLLEDLKPAYGLGNDSRAILPARGTPVTRIASARASHSR